MGNEMKIENEIDGKNVRVRGKLHNLSLNVIQLDLYNAVT